MKRKTTGGASTYGVRKKTAKELGIENLNSLFKDIVDLKGWRTSERIQWRRYGKGENFDNISMFNKKISEKEREILKLRDKLKYKLKIEIPSKYDFTHFIINENL